MRGVLVVDATTVRAWIERATTVIEAEQDHLTQLDAAIGDADHGANLVRGFRAAVGALADLQPGTPGEVLVTVGTTLVSKVGGASGPLYGTAFRRAGKTLGTSVELTPDGLGQALQAALDGVQGLGAAVEGDKTMVDALAPAVRAYHQARHAGAGAAPVGGRGERCAEVPGRGAGAVGDGTRERGPRLALQQPLGGADDPHGPDGVAGVVEDRCRDARVTDVGLLVLHRVAPSPHCVQGRAQGLRGGLRAAGEWPQGRREQRPQLALVQVGR